MSPRAPGSSPASSNATPAARCCPRPWSKRSWRLFWATWPALSTTWTRCDRFRRTSWPPLAAEAGLAGIHIQRGAGVLTQGPPGWIDLPRPACAPQEAGLNHLPAASLYYLETPAAQRPGLHRGGHLLGPPGNLAAPDQPAHPAAGLRGAARHPLRAPRSAGRPAAPGGRPGGDDPFSRPPPPNGWPNRSWS